MATYTVQSPDGKMITLQGPDGASHEDVIAQAQKLYQPAAPPAAPKQPGRLDTAVGEVKDAWNQLTGDIKTAVAPAAPAPAQRNGPMAPSQPLGTLADEIIHGKTLPRGALPTDHLMHMLAGGDNGTGEVHQNTQGGQAAVAADRVGGDLLNVPMSLVRAGIRFVDPKIDSQAAGGYSAALLAGAPLIRPAAAAAKVGVANAMMPSASAVDTAAMVNQFSKAGVDPMLAAKGGGAARMAKVTSENALVGGQVRGRLANAMDQAQQSAADTAEKYGAPAARGAAGEQVQQGVQDFNQRFSDRASNLYDKAFSEIDKGQQATLDAAQRAASLKTGQGGATAAPQPVIAPTATRAVLDDIGASVNAGGLSKIIQDPRLNNVASALDSGSADLRFGDLRALRTWAREAQSNPTLRQGISQGNLQRLEGALTQDITQNASDLAGPAAARKLQQADQFYRLGSQRIQTQLQNFVGKGGNAAGEQTYDLIARAASDKGGADIARLAALKKSLQPGEWGDVAASVINRLGKAPGGSGEDFSVNSFSTNFRNLSSQGKALLFGGGENRAALENLANVMDRLKGIEKMSNHSNSGANVQNASTLAGAGEALFHAGQGNLAPAGALVSALGGLRVTGNLMTNPGFVRWLAKGTQAAASKNPQAIAAATNQLRLLAQKDHRLLPVVSQLSLPSPGQADPATVAGQAKQGGNQP